MQTSPVEAYCGRWQVKTSDMLRHSYNLTVPTSRPLLRSSLCEAVLRQVSIDTSGPKMPSTPSIGTSRPEERMPKHGLSERVVSTKYHRPSRLDDSGRSDFPCLAERGDSVCIEIGHLYCFISATICLAPLPWTGNSMARCRLSSRPSSD